MATFGELAIKTEYEDEIDTGSPGPGFSNIDLNGTQPSMAKPSTYTSFEESIKNDPSYNGFSSNLRSLTNPYSTAIGVANDNNNNLPKGYNGAKHSSFSGSPTNGSNGNSATILVTSANGSNTSSSIISSVTEGSTRFARQTASTIESLRQWSKSAYKCTRQIVSEKLGKTSRTMDPELEGIIENLRDTKKKYESILTLAQSLAYQLEKAFDTQRQMAELFADLSQKSPELIEEFNANAETQRQLYKHGEILLRNINSFVSNLSTLCNKTIDDTLLTIRNYEAARLEFDANRHDLELLQSSPRNEKIALQIATLEQDLTAFKDKYDRLKKDVEIKIKFLDENRVKVMRKQLNFFLQSVNIYYTGNRQDLEEIMTQFNNRSQTSSQLDDSSNKMLSFLEHN